MTRAHIHTSAGESGPFGSEISQGAQIDPIFGIMFMKAQKNIFVAKPDTVNHSKSALFSRDDLENQRAAARDGRDCGIGKKRRSPTNPRSHVLRDREGGLEKKKRRYGQWFGDSRHAAMCEPRTRNNLERPCFLPVVEGTKRNLESARWVFCHFTIAGTDAFI